jgi:hydroxybutyrate-dimer hydrolase
VTYSDEFKTYQSRYTNGLPGLARSGNFGGRPVVIVHGRSDALVPVNHSSRPLVASALAAEGTSSKLSYIEVTNAQHFDAFNGNAALAGFDTRFIPLHVYFNRAMDAVYDNLRSSKALPASQVIRTTPRGGTPGAAPAITAANVPDFAATPAAGNAIRYDASTLTIPE